MSACGSTIVSHTLKKTDASVSIIQKNILHIYIRSKRSRRNSSLSSPRFGKRSRYARLLQRVKRLVGLKRRLYRLTSPTECGDHMHGMFCSTVSIVKPKTECNFLLQLLRYLCMLLSTMLLKLSSRICVTVCAHCTPALLPHP